MYLKRAGSVFAEAFMRSAKLFVMGMCAATALAMACGGSTTNSGGGNESDSGSSSGGGSGSSSGGGDATSSSSSGGTGSSSGAGSSSGSSSGGMGEGGLTCTPTSCGASSVCCASFGGGMVTDMCVSGTMCPTGSRQVCDPNSSNCPPGEMCVVRNGGMYGTCRAPRDGGGGEGGMNMDAAGGG
jgi:hypothetical protein